MNAARTALNAVRAVGLAYVDRKRIEVWEGRAEMGTDAYTGSLAYQIGDLNLALAQVVEAFVGGPR